MFCCVCEKETSMLGSKSSGPYHICKDCVKKIPSLAFESHYPFSDIGLIRLAKRSEIYNKTFSATASLGKLHIDNFNGLFAIADKIDDNGKVVKSNNIFSAETLTEYNLYCTNPKAEKSSVYVDIEFKFSTNDPVATYQVVVQKHSKCLTKKVAGTNITYEYPLEYQIFLSMFDDMIIQRHKKISDLLLSDSLYQRKLEIARGIFMLPEDYSEENLKKSRRLLMKAYHPDVAKEDVTYESQLINSYYDFLKMNLKEGHHEEESDNMSN